MYPPSTRGYTSVGGKTRGFRPRQPSVDTASPLEQIYKKGTETQAEDYSRIMQGYRDLPSSPAFQNIAGLAQTGGYSPTDISNIRERGISPIRSIYAGAQREMERGRALQGGYSPNLPAVRAKMAREMSESISGRTTDINAQLAQQIAQNRMEMASPYMQATAQPLEMQRGLYGTTPALSALFGQQAFQGAELGQRQQQINQQLLNQLLSGLR